MNIALRGINFSVVENACGAVNFFGEGFPFHRWWKFAGLTFRGCGFVAKTTTLQPRLRPDLKEGNMEMEADGTTPKQWKPPCIIAKPWPGVMLNAVGLSGPGAASLFNDGRWQARTVPFWLSFMSVANTKQERLVELEEFCWMLVLHLPDFQAPVGLEINISCPNVDHAQEELIGEAADICDRAGVLQIPLRLKFGPTASPAAIKNAAAHPACDAITLGNTLAWKDISSIMRLKLFGTLISPLAQYGGGGLSGWPLLPMIEDQMWHVRQMGFTKPIWACGGIDSVSAVRRVYDAGATGYQLGSVAVLRPWRMPRLIRFANSL